MLRAFLLAACVLGSSAYTAGSPRAAALQNSRVVSHGARHGVRAVSMDAEVSDEVLAATYSLDNLVLDGPMQPLKDMVLIKVAESEKQTQGGLFLTATGSDTPTRGTVVAVGPGKPHPHTDVLITMPLSEGDDVLFGQYQGTKVKYCLDDHVVITLDDIVAKLDGDNVVPIRDRLLLKPIEKPVETSAGIVLTQEAAKAQEVPNQGEVVAVGEGRFTAKGELEPVDVKVGQKVMYTKYGGTEIEFNGEKLIFVFGADCLAKYD